MKFQLLTLLLIQSLGRGHSHSHSIEDDSQRFVMQMEDKPSINSTDLGTTYSLNELLYLDTYPTLNLPAEGEPLLPPKQIVATEDNSGPKTVKVVMRYDVVKYIGPSYTTLLKLYNGGVGPTIRVKPGDTLILELHNDLEGPLGHYGHNQYMLPNTTNVSFLGISIVLGIFISYVN